MRSIIVAEQQNVMLTLFAFGGGGRPELSYLKKGRTVTLLSCISVLAKVPNRAYEAPQCHRFLTNCKNAEGKQRSDCAVTVNSG